MHTCMPLCKRESTIANYRHATNLTPALQRLTRTSQLMRFLEVAQAVKLQILQSRKDRGPMKSPGSGIEPDTRDLPSSDPRPDPSWGIPQLTGKLRYGHKALSGIRASPTFARLRADGCQMDAKHQIKTPRIVADSMHRLHEGIGLQSKRGPAVHTFVSNIA